MSFPIVFFFTLGSHEPVSNPGDILRSAVWGLHADTRLCLDLQQRCPLRLTGQHNPIFIPSAEVK